MVKRGRAGAPDRSYGNTSFSKVGTKAPKTRRRTNPYKNFDNGAPQWHVPPLCPVKQLTEAMNGKLRRDFSCAVCLVSPLYCSAYLAGDPKVVAHFAAFLRLARVFKEVK